MQIRHLPPLLRFIPQFAQICIIFALSKFEAHPVFRPVLLSYFDSVFDPTIQGYNSAVGSFEA